MTSKHTEINEYRKLRIEIAAKVFPSLHSEYCSGCRLGEHQVEPWTEAKQALIWDALNIADEIIAMSDAQVKQATKEQLGE